MKHQPLWSKWGEWLTAIVAIGTSVGLAGAWLMQYANREGNARLIERVTYIVEDRSWMPPGASPLQPLVGLHYFGDLAIVLGYGEVINPYIIPGMPAQYPPIAILAFKGLALLPPLAALLAVVIASVVLVPFAVWHLMKGLAVPLRIVTVVILVIVTIPMISALDRGGLQFIAVGCLGLAMWAYGRNNQVLAIALFVLAVSLKSYLLVFAIYPFFRGHRSFAVKAVVTAIVLNAVLFLAFPGRPTVSFGGFLTSTLFFSTTDMVVDGNSLASVPLRIVEMTLGTGSAEELLGSASSLLTLVTLVWVLVIAWLASRKLVPHWISMSLVLASATMVVGAAYPYNYAWASLAAFYFGSRNSDPFPFVASPGSEDKPRTSDVAHISTWENRGRWLLGERTMRILILVTIAVSLVPQFWIFDGPSGDGRRAISFFPPVLVVVATLAALVFWMMNRRVERRIGEVRTP